MEENNSIYEVNEMENNSIYEAEPETEVFDDEYEETENKISIYEAEPETEMVTTKSNVGIGIAIGAAVIGAAAVAGKVVYDKIKESKDPEITAKKNELKELKKTKREERKQQLKEKFKFGKKDELKKIDEAAEVVDVDYEEVKEP